MEGDEYGDGDPLFTTGVTIPMGPRRGPLLPAHDTRAVSAAPLTSIITSPGDLCVTCGRAPGVPRLVPLRTVHCGPCWAKFGGSPDAEEIGPPPAEALGSRDPYDQLEWLDRLAGEQWVQLLRRDCRGRLLRMVRELALTADWNSWESWPGWDQLMEVSGWARSTLAGWLRQLRLLGWLAVIESGSTPQFRPLALAHVEGNRRAVYALRVPLRRGEQRPESSLVRQELAVPLAEHGAAWRSFPAGVGTRSHQRGCRVVDKTWTPTWSFDFSCSVGRWVSSHGKDFFHNSQVNAQISGKTKALRDRLDNKWLAFADRVPTSGAQMLAAAAELRRQHPVLALLSIRAGRALCRPYWRAGWTNNDVLHALEYRPTSWSTLPAMSLTKIVAPYRWAQSRLSAWHTESGQVLPGHTRANRDRRTHGHVLTTRHGRAAVAALPAGATQLHPGDIRRYGRGQVNAAVETFRRRRTAELAAVRAAIRPPEQVASPQHRSRMSAEIRAQRKHRRTPRTDLHERLLTQARAATAKRQCQAEPETTWTPSKLAETPQERHELALARARAEGHVPLNRRRRIRYHANWE